MPGLAAPPEYRDGHLLGRNEINELAKRWTPPVVFIGMSVMWHRHPRGRSVGTLGIVASHNKGTNTIEVMLPADDRYTREGCRHVTDPHVLGEGYDSENGCWEHTEYFNRTVGAIADLEKRVASLQRQAAGAGKQSKPVKPT